MSTLVGGMCSISCHMALVLAFMHYSIFSLQLFLSILFYNYFNLLLKRQTKRSMVPAFPNFICFFFYESNTEGTNFRIMFIYVLRLYNVLVLYCIQLVSDLIDC